MKESLNIGFMRIFSTETARTLSGKVLSTKYAQKLPLPGVFQKALRQGLVFGATAEALQSDQRRNDFVGNACGVGIVERGENDWLLKTIPAEKCQLSDPGFCGGVEERDPRFHAR